MGDMDRHKRNHTSMGHTGEKFKSGVMPSYMKPTKALLQKHNEQNTMVDLKDKIKGRLSIMPAKKLKIGILQALQTDSKDNLHSKLGQKAKQQKYFVLNRQEQNNFIVETFRQISQEKKDVYLQRIKLNKGKMKAYLSKKYKGRIAEKILSFMDMSVPLTFEDYIDMIEKMINFQAEKMKKMTYRIFDFAEDQSICELDLYALMKIYEGDENLFIETYARDL